MINLVSVCTDRYPMIYAYKLHRRFNSLTNLNVSHWCITDRPTELPSFIKPITPFKKSKGWWNKLNLYCPKMPEGWILYMDLDIVILKNFDEEILEMVNSKESMICVSDAIGWMGEKFSSSLMCFESGAHEHIYSKFIENEAEINDLEGGDQVWTGPQLDSVAFIDDKFPSLKKNLKFHLAKLTEGKVEIPFEICEEVKLVDCGGRPKPHELEILPYIKNSWHLVH